MSYLDLAALSLQKQESMPFVEAMRQLRRRAGKNNFVQVATILFTNIEHYFTEISMLDSCFFSPSNQWRNEDETNTYVR